MSCLTRRQRVPDGVLDLEVHAARVVAVALFDQPAEVRTTVNEQAGSTVNGCPCVQQQLVDVAVSQAARGVGHR